MANPENVDEKRAKKWLREQGYDPIRPERDPPDYVVEGNCAVEVVRLSQKILVANRKNASGKEMEYVSEEEKQEPLRKFIENTISEINKKYLSFDHRRWYVDIEYNLSNPYWSKPKIVAREITKTLELFLQPDGDTALDMYASRLSMARGKYREFLYLNKEKMKWIPLECGLDLNLIEGTPQPEGIFILQGVESDTGICTADEIILSLQQVLPKKRDKIIRSLHEHNKNKNYQFWWLIVVDHVMGVDIQSLSAHELQEIKNEILIMKAEFVNHIKREFTFWDRILIIGSRPGSTGYDLYSANSS